VPAGGNQTSVGVAFVTPSASAGGALTAGSASATDFNNGSSQHGTGSADQPNAVDAFTLHRVNVDPFPLAPKAVGRAFDVVMPDGSQDRGFAAVGDGTNALEA
jgi:hypothetical protein